MSAAQVKSQCFFEEVLVNNPTADVVVVNCLNRCPLCQLDQVFIIQAEFQLHGLFFLHFMQAGNGKADATPGNISNVDNPTLSFWRVNHAIGPGQTDLFSVMTSEVKVDREYGITFTTDFKGVFFFTIWCYQDLLCRFAGRAYYGYSVVGADKSLGHCHEI